MVDFFRALGRSILERWERARFDASAFPELAAAALGERPPSAHVDPMEIVRHVERSDALETQEGPEVDFGEPAITVFRCERFRIDVLFWVDGTTTIHEHAFSGAFHVMQGGSLESRYAFSPTRRLSERLLLGDLALRSVDRLRAGDVRPIHPGAKLVHALFHLDRPSVSVVVRTPRDDGARPQYDYARPGIAFDPYHRTDVMRRRLAILRMLSRTGYADFDTHALYTVQSADAPTAFHLLTGLRPEFRDPASYLAFLQRLRPAHPELVEALVPWEHDQRRTAHIVRLRALAKNAEHRFFLAVLLNVTDRRRILDAVQAEHPTRPASESVLRWIAELARVDRVNAWVAQTAGATAVPAMVDFPVDERTMNVARRMLEDRWSGPTCEGEAAAEQALRASLLVGAMVGP
jgi:hypothetical protein